MNRKIRAIGLLSGGLDSAIAAAVVARQGIEVIGVNISIGFESSIMRREIAGESRIQILEEEEFRLSSVMRVPVKVIDRSSEYIELLFNPKHGYGANANPCIDCHVFMIREAAKMMGNLEASFVFTGEVLGQRPMSQSRMALEIVARESGLGGLLVRPLSAKLLPLTVPEIEGWLDREQLLDIKGRSRTKQIEIASRLGIEGYSSPAGGCLLTEPNYARKVLDWMRYEMGETLSHEETLLFSVGRHFRLSRGARAIVGRRQAENEYIERSWSANWLLSPLEVPGPTAVVLGNPTKEDLSMAASLVARYSDAKHLSSTPVCARRRNEEFVFDAVPASLDLIEASRI